MPEENNNGIEETVPTVDNTVDSSTEQVSEPVVNVEQPTVTDQTVVVDQSVFAQAQENVQPGLGQLNQFGQPMSSDFTGNGKKKKNLVPVFVILLLVVALGAGGFYFFQMSSNPTKILKNAIADAYKDFSKELKELDKSAINFDILKDTLLVDGELSVGGDLLKDLADDSVKFSVGFDAANKKMEASAVLAENKKDLLDATVFGKDGKLYIKSNTLFNNTYKIDEFDFDEVIDLSEIEEAMKEVNLPSTDDIDYIVKALSESIANSLDEKSMEKSKDEIKINGTSVKTTKITYTIDKKSMAKFTKAVIKNIKKDDKLIEKIANIAEISKDEIKSALEEAEKEITDEAFDGIKGKFNIYTAGLKNEVAKVEFIMDGVTISYANYKDNAEFKVAAKEEGINLLVTSKTTKGVSDIEVKFNDVKYASFTVRQFDEKGIDFDYDINVPAVATAKGSIKFTVKKVNDKEAKGEVSFKVNAEAQGQKIDVSAKFNYSIKVGGKVADYDTSKALDSDEITEEDETKAMEAVAALANTKAYKFISTFIPAEDDNDNDNDNDYDFDFDFDTETNENEEANTEDNTDIPSGFDTETNEEESSFDTEVEETEEN